MIEDPQRDVMDRARILVLRGQEGDALATLDELLFANPAHEGALLLKAELLLESHRDREALELTQAAVAFRPESSESRNALARCLHAMGDNESALTEAAQARQLLSVGENAIQTGPVYLTLVWCLRSLRRLDEALATAEEGLLRCPDAILAHWAEIVEEELGRAQAERCE
jgi:tetratricopeptide (TPR) repeat protein